MCSVSDLSSDALNLRSTSLSRNISDISPALPERKISVDAPVIPPARKLSRDFQGINPARKTSRDAPAINSTGRRISHDNSYLSNTFSRKISEVKSDPSISPFNILLHLFSVVNEELSIRNTRWVLSMQWLKI